MYAGHHPADSEAAIHHLEDLRAAGRAYLVPATSSWWLDHYDDFRNHLERHDRCIVDHPELHVLAGGNAGRMTSSGGLHARAAERRRAERADGGVLCVDRLRRTRSSASTAGTPLADRGALAGEGEIHLFDYEDRVLAVAESLGCGPRSTTWSRTRTPGGPSTPTTGA